MNVPIEVLVLAVIEALALAKLGAKQEAEELLECPLVLITFRGVVKALPVLEATATNPFNRIDEAPQNKNHISV